MRGQAALLRLSKPKSSTVSGLIKANTHLQWDPELDFARAAQALKLLEHLSDFAEQARPLLNLKKPQCIATRNHCKRAGLFCE